MELIILSIVIINTILIAWLIFDRSSERAAGASGVITLDSSAIIDGRILEVAKVGFLPKNIHVPQFIIDELHNIADSADSLRRERGRFGLEVVNELGKLPGTSVEVIQTGKSDKPVDDRLVDYTKKVGGRVVSNDYALNQIAELSGVQVLNVNELNQAIRTIALPGEKVTIKIVQKGSDPKQGVGYLEDGTMVVVDRADRLIGKEITATITRVLQTSAGKMLFAEREKTGNRKNRGNGGRGSKRQGGNGRSHKKR